MCGIAGVFYRDGSRRPPEPLLLGMAAMMSHRGPDGCGIFAGPGAGLALARLSIIDLAGGWQPLAAESGRIWLVCNGEIFNHPELRQELEARGHRFRTASDVEVLLHLYEDEGMPKLLERVNGQFAFCLYDEDRRRAYFARDRVGIHPLHYVLLPDRVLFASEAKALFVDPDATPRLDPVALDQVFTFWAPLPGRTLFEGVREVPPAHVVEWDLRKWEEPRPARYWECAFPGTGRDGRGLAANADELLERLKGATRIRLRADVPVGAYLSGGIDSSAVASLIVRHMDSRVETFSIGFEDEAFDEERFQREVVERLGVRHRRILCTYDDIARAIPRVVWHAERPVIRTAPAPMFLLSGLVHRSGYRVVVTGEGADEFLGGYDLYKEALIRAFWGRVPGSTMRPLLLRRLYPYLPHYPGRADHYLRSFFGKGLGDGTSPAFSHGTRWETTSAIKGFYAPGFPGASPLDRHLAELARWISPAFAGWHPLERAQHVEVTTLLSQYLLSAQGDRVAMAHSVEARFPFLDPGVIDFANSLPPSHKISGLREKAVLKRAMAGYLPESVIRRTKQPYMAPDADSFVKSPSGRDIVAQHLSPEAVARRGIFDPRKVERLLAKCVSGRAAGFRDNMAFVGILTTQIFCDQFLDGQAPFRPAALPEPRLRCTS